MTSNAPVNVIAFAELRSSWALAQQAIGLAREADLTECKAAKMFAEWHDCKDTDDLLKKADQRIERLNQAVAAMEYGINRLQEKDVVQLYLSRREGWNSASTQLAELGHLIHERLQVKEWTGDAAEQYRAQLPAQINALGELAGLAVSQARASNHVALINAIVFASTRAGVRQIEQYANTNMAPRVNESAETVQGVDWPRAHYLFRTWAMERQLWALNSWLIAQLQPGTASWGAAARQLDNSLVSMTASPETLQQYGQWPGIGEAVGAGVADTSQVVTQQVSKDDPRLAQGGGYYSWN